MVGENISTYKINLSREKRLLKELNSLVDSISDLKNSAERNMVLSQMQKVEDSLIKSNSDSLKILKNIGFVKKLKEEKKLSSSVFGTKDVFESERFNTKNEKEKSERELEKITIERLKKEKPEVKKKIDYLKPSPYTKFSNRIFAGLSRKLLKGNAFRSIEKSLIKSNLQKTSYGYLSIIFSTTLLSFIASFLLFIFLLFFNIQSTYPFLTGVSESIGMRVLKTAWILFLVPLVTFFFMYFYPFFEKKSLEHRIDHELPFAAIHMAAISGSMIDPTKIFEIVVSTKEYPFLEREFAKLLNQINVYGYNIASALRNVAFNSPSVRLAELFNGMATTITSGGDLSDFFEKRAENLLFEHRLEREKETKTSETFMDIYVSVVIAAPMILMLLVMMIKISGIGISLSTAALGLIFVLGVTMVNLAFLTFLHIKQASD